MATRLARGTVVAFACLVVSGCSKSAPSNEPASTPPVPPIVGNPVWFAPDDLMTDVASTPLSVNFGSPPADDVVDTIRAGIAVRTYPGRQAIAFSTTIRTALSAGKGYPPSKYIDIVPQASVSNQWIVLSIATLPVGFRSGSAVPNNEPDLGAVVARVNGGSAPIVRLARLGGTGTGGDVTRFELVLSERIALSTATLGSYLRVSSTDGTPCRFLTVPNLTGYSTIDFDCPGIRDSSQQAHLEMHAGLQGLSGVPLGVLRIPCDRSVSPAGPAEYNADLDFTNGAGCSTACKQIAVATTTSCDQ
jgi:hypothetical protein